MPGVAGAVFFHVQLYEKERKRAIATISGSLDKPQLRLEHAPRDQAKTTRKRREGGGNGEHSLALGGWGRGFGEIFQERWPRGGLAGAWEFELGSK